MNTQSKRSPESPTPPASYHKKRSLTRSIRKGLSNLLGTRTTKKRDSLKDTSLKGTAFKTPKKEKKVEFSPSTKPPAPMKKFGDHEDSPLSRRLSNKSTLCKNGIKPVFEHDNAKLIPYYEYINHYNKANPLFSNYGCGQDMRLKYEEGRYCCVDPSQQATDEEILDHIYMLIESHLENVNFLDITREYKYHPLTEKQIANSAKTLRILSDRWMAMYKSLKEQNPDFTDDDGLKLHARATDKLREITEFMRQKRTPFQYSSEELDVIHEMEEERNPTGANVYGYSKRRTGRKTFG